MIVSKHINGMSISRNVALKIMERIPMLDKLKGKNWYDVEDAITEVLDENRFCIYDDVKYDFLCKDVIWYIANFYGKQCFNAEFISAVAERVADNNESNISHWDNIAAAIIWVGATPEFNKYFTELIKM